MASKMRSPNYPALTLPQVVDSARKLWAAEQKSAVDHTTAATDMGYKSLSGPARVTIGSMRQYGLIEKADKGHLRLSPLAITILHGNENERLDALAEAATTPKLFAELAKLHVTSSEANIRSYLITKKGFAEDGARKAARAFRETVNLATKTQSGYDSNDSEEQPEAMSGNEVVQITPPAARTPQGEVERVRVSLKGGRLARIVFSGDLPTQADIDKVIASLELQKDSFPTGD